MAAIGCVKINTTFLRYLFAGDAIGGPCLDRPVSAALDARYLDVACDDGWLGFGAENQSQHDCQGWSIQTDSKSTGRSPSGSRAFRFQDGSRFAKISIQSEVVMPRSFLGALTGGPRIGLLGKSEVPVRVLYKHKPQLRLRTQPDTSGIGHGREEIELRITSVVLKRKVETSLSIAHHPLVLVVDLVPVCAIRGQPAELRRAVQAVEISAEL